MNDPYGLILAVDVMHINSRIAQHITKDGKRDLVYSLIFNISQKRYRRMAYHLPQNLLCQQQRNEQRYRTVRWCVPHLGNQRISRKESSCMEMSAQLERIRAHETNLIAENKTIS